MGLGRLARRVADSVSAKVGSRVEDHHVRRHHRSRVDGVFYPDGHQTEVYSRDCDHMSGFGHTQPGYQPNLYNSENGRQVRGTWEGHPHPPGMPAFVPFDAFSHLNPLVGFDSYYTPLLAVPAPAHDSHLHFKPLAPESTSSKTVVSSWRPVVESQGRAAAVPVDSGSDSDHDHGQENLARPNLT